jgi:hypothetical protein
MPYVGKTKWTLHRVVGHLHKDMVNSAVADATGEKPGDKRHFLPNYQPTLKDIVSNLSPEEQKEYQEVADNWNKEGAPDDVRRKYVLLYHRTSTKFT